MFENFKAALKFKVQFSSLTLRAICKSMCCVCVCVQKTANVGILKPIYDLADLNHAIETDI